MAIITLANKESAKVATAKELMFVGVKGLYFGFGSTTPNEWFSAQAEGEYFTISSGFGDIWLKYDLDVAGSPASKTIKYQVGV